MTSKSFSDLRIKLLKKGLFDGWHHGIQMGLKELKLFSQEYPKGNKEPTVKAECRIHCLSILLYKSSLRSLSKSWTIKILFCLSELPCISSFTAYPKVTAELITECEQSWKKETSNKGLWKAQGVELRCSTSDTGAQIIEKTKEKMEPFFWKGFPVRIPFHYTEQIAEFPRFNIWLAFLIRNLTQPTVTWLRHTRELQVRRLVCGSALICREDCQQLPCFSLFSVKYTKTLNLYWTTFYARTHVL